MWFTAVFSSYPQATPHLPTKFPQHSHQAESPEQQELLNHCDCTASIKGTGEHTHKHSESKSSQLTLGGVYF